jgi:hypothetical protein
MAGQFVSHELRTAFDTEQMEEMYSGKKVINLRWRMRPI